MKIFLFLHFFFSKTEQTLSLQTPTPFMADILNVNSFGIYKNIFRSNLIYFTIIFVKIEKKKLNFFFQKPKFFFFIFEPSFEF